MKKILISTALGAVLLAGGVAIAQPGGGDAPRRGAMMGDTNGDGQVTKAELAASLEQRFAKMDLNGDGKVTKEERDALKQKRFDEHFAKLDTDGNGQISKAEFQAARDARKAKWSQEGGKDRRGPGMGGFRHGPGMMMGRGMDGDKDGTITKAEFMARPLAMFDRADANKDGVLTADEMKAARPDRPGRGWGKRGGPAGGETPPPPQDN